MKTNSTKIIALVFTLGLVFNSKSQIVSTFIKTISTPSTSLFPNGVTADGIVFDNSDNTFIVNVNSSSPKRCGIVKMDTVGNIIWMNNVSSGLSSVYLSEGVIQNGKYKTFLKDNTNSFSANNHLSSVYSTSLNGNYSGVTARYGGFLGSNDGDGHLFSEKVLPSQKKIACGYVNTTSSVGNSKSNWFVKLDQNDSVIWSRYLDYFSGFNNFNDCDYNSSNFYFFAGVRNNFGTGNDLIVIKTDSLGNKIWDYQFDKNYNDETGVTCKAMSDGGVIVFGISIDWISSNPTMFGIRLDANGVPLWSKNYYGSYPIGLSNHGINILPNGNILLTGYHALTTTACFGSLMTVNPTTGALLTANRYAVGSPGYTSFSRSIIRGNSIYTIGSTSPTSNSIYDIMLMKTTLATNFTGTSCTSNTVALADSNYVFASTYYNNANNVSYISKSAKLSYTQNSVPNSLSTVCSGTAVVTGISSEKASDQLSIYPNPVKNILNINLDKEITSAQILNAIGQLVLTKNNINATNTSIDLSNLSQGVYFVNLNTYNGAVIRKIIKE